MDMGPVLLSMPTIKKEINISILK